MDLSFIIVNYQSEKYLLKCLSSIKEKVLDVNYETIVVNNGIYDLEVSLPSEVEIVNMKKNIGYGAGCNAGAKIAKGDILCFLNPDTEILSNNMGDILKKFSNNKQLGVIGPKLLRENGKTQWWCAGKEFTFWRLIKNNLGLIDSKKIWESEKEILADWVSGAALFIQKEIFEKIRGFDENFFMYFEDEDLCRRIRILGYKVLYYPNFIIYHAGGKSRKNIFKQKMQFFKSMAVYIGKRLRQKG